MILSQLRIGARSTTYAALVRGMSRGSHGAIGFDECSDDSKDIYACVIQIFLVDGRAGQPELVQVVQSRGPCGPKKSCLLSTSYQNVALQN